MHCGGSSARAMGWAKSLLEVQIPHLHRLRSTFVLSPCIIILSSSTSLLWSSKPAIFGGWIGDAVRMYFHVWKRTPDWRKLLAQDHFWKIRRKGTNFTSPSDLVCFRDARGQTYLLSRRWIYIKSCCEAGDKRARASQSRNIHGSSLIHAIEFKVPQSCRLRIQPCSLGAY